MAPSSSEAPQDQARPQKHPNASTKQQSSISEAFKAAKHGAVNSNIEGLSPDSKRRKLNTVQSTPPKMLSAEDMYSFETQKTNGHAVVDLTNSPSSSPARSRKASNAGIMVPANPQNGVKRLVVRNMKPSSKTDSAPFCKKTLAQLDEALTSIFEGRRPVLSNEELYKGSENLCRLGRAETLAKKLFERCKAQITGPLKAPLADQVSAANSEALQAVVATWKRWMRELSSIRAIFFYLDRAYLLQRSLPQINEKCIEYFRKNIFDDAQLQPKIINGICDILSNVRSGEALQIQLFGDAVKMLMDLGVYTKEFEPQLLAVSQKFVVEWSEKAISEEELPQYVRHCNELMETEIGRCETFNLPQSTQRSLLTVLEDVTIERRQADLTNDDSVADLLDESKVQDLAALFALLEKRRLGSSLKGAFFKWIDDTGTAIVFDEKQQEQMVPKLLELKQNMDYMWRHSFSKNRPLGDALRDAFANFMNKSKKSSATWNTDNSKTGEMIAKYVDTLLRAGAKAIPENLASGSKDGAPLSLRPTKSKEDDEEDDEEKDEDEQVNRSLDQVLDLFRFLHGKAVFEAFYKKDLARRLLMGRSASNDAERAMLARLRSECGSSFTKNLEQMFLDVERAREEMAGYKERKEQREAKASVDITVNVLSQAAWPTYPDPAVIIPPEIKKAIDAFESYYNNAHTGRMLTWKHALAHCQMKAKFAKSQKELVVSSFQAIVLLLFNGVGENEHVKYEHLKSETGLSDAELKRTLQSLACAKLRPLTKHPKGRDVNETDTFTLNMGFEHPKYRVKINQIQLKETKEENKETHERIAADRQYETQAAIVRIMKSRKSIGHQELIAETIKATRTRGVLQPQDIKKEIDKLIDKEYMERADGGLYEYLA